MKKVPFGVNTKNNALLLWIHASANAVVILIAQLWNVSLTLYKAQITRNIQMNAKTCSFRLMLLF